MSLEGFVFQLISVFSVNKQHSHMLCTVDSTSAHLFALHIKQHLYLQQLVLYRELIKATMVVTGTEHL